MSEFNQREKTYPPQPAPTCWRCGGEMKPGIAIAQTYVGSPDFPGDTGSEDGCTFSPGGPGKIIDALKCVKCGHSFATIKKP
jgi:hypothetical protein